jgi:hypothetical protein
LPKPRIPRSRAIIEGRIDINPGRYNRKEPTAGPLGDPPKWASEAQAKAWGGFQSELPWLNHSHRCLVEIASILRARLESGVEIGTKALSLLRLCLSSMGATPSDASKVSWAEPEEPDDLLD